MPVEAMKRFDERTLDTLTIDDERSFRHVGLYADLKKELIDARYAFRIMPAADRWDRALFLNLTYWASGQGDVLVDDHIPADVVAHVAWHHLAASAVPAPISSDALFLGESIASAFDLYLVGRLLGHSPDSSFLETQVSAMADSTSSAGLSEEAFETLLDDVGKDPDRAFEDLRELLFDAASALVACSDVDAANAVLTGFETHRFACLLHHYELSNWVLYARAYAATALAPDARVRAIDRALREAPVALDWLEHHWLGSGRPRDRSGPA